MNNQSNIRLTQFSHGGGCGCKIAPSVLSEILKGASAEAPRELLVGYQSNDDAAVYDLGDGSALISTTDFFMPIVDDAFDFGRIAAANAISDVYAMGGRPLMALAVLGWPVEKLPLEVAREVLRGAREICALANIPLAGGHSIDSAEPIFGLSVSGKVKTEHLKKNNTANAGDLIFLTKPIGAGILSTAQKRGAISNEHLAALIDQLASLNRIGEVLGGIPGVTAMTDVTGFGLLGHLIEMADGAGLSAHIHYSKVPIMDGAREYLKQRIVPDATYRNWNSYSAKTFFDKGVDVMEAFNLLPDPQTNGGIMFTCSPGSRSEAEAALSEHNIVYATTLGRMVEAEEKTVSVFI
ncbi:MAG: selenide, water dikinase SelD [Chitinophagaceae bacterium]|nr:MAG: selenide, water dikinase SelD [Chitinophagaceae bacterium]